MRLLFLFFLNLNVFGQLLVSCTTTVLAPDESISESEKNSIYDETGCLFTSYEGLVMAGYQGWFTAEGDGADRGWHHYEKNRTFVPGVSTIDF